MTPARLWRHASGNHLRKEVVRAHKWSLGGLACRGQTAEAETMHAKQSPSSLVAAAQTSSINSCWPALSRAGTMHTASDPEHDQHTPGSMETDPLLPKRLPAVRQTPAAPGQSATSFHRHRKAPSAVFLSSAFPASLARPRRCARRTTENSDDFRPDQQW